MDVSFHTASRTTTLPAIQSHLRSPSMVEFGNKSDVFDELKHRVEFDREDENYSTHFDKVSLERGISSLSLRIIMENSDEKTQGFEHSLSLSLSLSLSCSY